MTGEVNNNLVTPEMLATPDSLVASTVALGGMESAHRGKKFLVGATLALGTLVAAELPAPHADAATPGIEFVKAYRVGCRANGTSSGFAAKFEIKGLKNKDIGALGRVDGTKTRFYTQDFYPESNDWTKKLLFGNPYKSHPTVPAGHPEVKAKFHYYQSGVPIGSPLYFKLPRC